MKLVPASGIPRHSLVKYKDELFVLENQPKIPVLCRANNTGIDITKCTLLEVIKYPAEMAFEVLANKSREQTGMLLALEFGYKQCEKGNNLDAAFINFNNLK